MLLSLSWQLFFILLCLSFLITSELSKTVFVRFLFGYLKYLFRFLAKLSYYYLKLIGVFFIWYKALFFSNLMPSFIQILLSFHFLFNFFWELYLLIIIYSSILVCLPYYGFIFIQEKTICIHSELKSVILMSLIVFFNFELAFCTISNLICIDKLYLNRSVFLSTTEYDLIKISFTEKSLKELQIHVKENYDKTMINFYKKQR
jgi:hypothetical protein